MERVHHDRGLEGPVRKGQGGHVGPHETGRKARPGEAILPEPEQRGREVQRDGPQTQSQEQLAHPARSSTQVEHARAGRDVEVGRRRHEHVQQAQALGPVLRREGLAALPGEIALVRVALDLGRGAARREADPTDRTPTWPPRRDRTALTTGPRPAGGRRRRGVARSGARATAGSALRLRARPASARRSATPGRSPPAATPEDLERRRGRHARRPERVAKEGPSSGANAGSRHSPRASAAAVRTMKQRSTSPFAIERLTRRPRCPTVGSRLRRPGRRSRTRPSSDTPRQAVGSFRTTRPMADSARVRVRQSPRSMRRAADAARAARAARGRRSPRTARHCMQ